jgi:hypothetical protein
MPIPDDDRIAEVARQVCLAHGDSWIADDGAQDQWTHTVELVIAALRLQGWTLVPVEEDEP